METAGGDNKRFLSEWKKMSFPLEDIFTFYQKLPISSQSLTRVATTKIHCLHHPLCPPYPVTTKGNEEQLLQPVLQSHMCPATLPSAPVLPSESLHYVPVYNTDKAAVYNSSLIRFLTSFLPHIPVIHFPYLHAVHSTFRIRGMILTFDDTSHFHQ